MIENRQEFSYKRTSKYQTGDTFFNFQNFFLFTSRQITGLLYKTSITPHQVIFVSLILGTAASVMIIQESRIVVIIGAVLLFYKNVLDKVDGSLARAKNVVSRRGRFYDSISDFIVSFSLFTAIGIKLHQIYDSSFAWAVSYAALICSMLQCSFFIYYGVAFIKETGNVTINRLRENVTDEDLKTEDKFTIFLQRVFQVIYGWQDYLVYRIDSFLIQKLEGKFKNHMFNINSVWYKDKLFLSISSLLGIGTHMVLIGVSAVIGHFEYYLILNLILWNLLLIFNVFYHYSRAKIIINGQIN